MTNQHHPSILDRFVRDRDGKVVLAQKPNLPLIGWLVFSALAFLISKGTLYTGFQNVARASLFTWAFLEIRHGVNPFRRVLGSVVMIGVVADYFHN